MFVSRAMSDCLCVDAVKDKDESACQPSTLGILTPPPGALADRVWVQEWGPVSVQARLWVMSLQGTGHF